jgi:amino acid transporter
LLDLAASTNRSGLGTFGGVFTPSILTILGVIMYLRLGWVVGNVGLGGTLIIVTVSTAITFLTGLSIAAIATDQRVKTGGAYYMISRSLGLESGGAIGVSLYIAQTLSVALYSVGFAESVARVFHQLSESLVGIITTVAVTALALVSAKAAIRAQYIIMIGIVLSLISLVFGQPLQEREVIWGIPEKAEAGFWQVFAVFFPAVTGIMAGVNMSGDLRDPKKSIPLGTFAAIGAGYVIYMLIPIILANRASTADLINDPLIMRKISYWGDAILIGVWGATLSSAVGSILGAPRVLQALARDGVLPKSMKWLGKGEGSDDTPRRGTIFTLIIVLVAVWFGDLNLIAPILTMFFLTTYGVLNITAGTEQFLKSPSFRPRFKVHWLFSFVGAFGCTAVMILIDATATAVAIAFIGLIFFGLKKRELVSVWGNVGRGVRMAVIRSTLLRLSEDHDPKNWRPNPIVLAGSPTKRWHLIELANNLVHKQGILTVASMIPEDRMGEEQMKRLKSHIRNFLKKNGVEGLVKVMATNDPFTGGSQLLEAYGLGALQPNTVILGESENAAHFSDFCKMINRFHQLKRNVLIVHKGVGKTFGEKKRIDVWWGGLKGNGGLMMILAYLINNSLDWRQAEVHVKMVVKDERASADIKENIANLLEKIRINAIIDVIPSKNHSFEKILRQQSGTADLVFMGMAIPNENFTDYYRSLILRIKELPTTVLALAGQEVSFGEVLIKQEESVSH